MAYQHVPNRLRKKLDDKGDHMILEGYHSTGGYMLYDVNNKRIVITRDIVYDKIKEMQQPIITYQQTITNYNNEKLVPTIFDSAKTIFI